MRARKSLSNLGFQVVIRITTEEGAGVLALVQPFGLRNPSNEVLMQLFMYGNKDFPDEINRNILELTLHFIHETNRFD